MIGAMVISVGEPQLDRCMEYVRNQIVQFANILHLDGIVPNSEAFNRGLREVTDEWVMHIGGDMILYPDAVKIAYWYVGITNPEICCYSFWVKDTFLECDTGFCSVLRTEAWKSITFEDSMWDDRQIVHRLRAKGWRTRKPRDVIATHFDSPDDFQVFRRFYFHGSKFNNNSFVRTRMSELYEKTRNPLYVTCVKAIEFAKLNRHEIGSPNINIAKEKYVDFNDWRGISQK